MIKLIVLDIDGTMTNGAITYDSNGVEYKSFNVKDGLAIASWHKLGKKSAIITGRNSAIVQKRADELGITYIHQGVKDKLKILKKIAKKENITFDEIAVIGDDLNDYDMLKITNHSFCPKDASNMILDAVSIKLNKKGGDGAVAKMIEYIIKKENLTKDYKRLWIRQ